MTENETKSEMRVLYAIGTGTKRHLAAEGATRALCGAKVNSKGQIAGSIPTCEKCEKSSPTPRPLIEVLGGSR